MPNSTQLKYNDLIEAFKKILQHSTKSQGGQSDHLHKGLGKLHEAEAEVAHLREKAGK